MPLNKGFLSFKNPYEKVRLSTGIFLGILYSANLYGFFYFLREVLRISTSEFGGKILLILSPLENFYYNLVFGLIASILGFYTFLRFLFENSIKPLNKKLRLRQRHLLSELGFFQWSFLSAYGRLASITGIWFLTFHLQFEIDFLKDFWLMIAMIPIALYLGAWLTLSRIIKKSRLKWFLVSTTVIIGMSLLYSNLNLIDYSKINQKLKAKSIELSFDFRIPKTKTDNNRFPRRYFSSLYLVYDTAIKNSRIFIEDKQNETSIKQLAQKIDSIKSNRYISFVYGVNIVADERLRLGFVDSVKYELRKAQINLLSFSANPIDSRYPWYYPAYKNRGIRSYLPNLYPSFISFLDSVEVLNLDNHRIIARESPMYRNDNLRSFNRIVVTVKRNTIKLNSRVVNKNELGNALRSLIKHYKSGIIILYDPDKEISYGRYIKFLDLIYSAIDENRDEISRMLFQKELEDVSSRYQIDQINDILPRQVIEYTPEEKRLERLLKE